MHRTCFLDSLNDKNMIMAVFGLVYTNCTWALVKHWWGSFIVSEGSWLSCSYPSSGWVLQRFDVLIWQLEDSMKMLFLILQKPWSSIIFIYRSMWTGWTEPGAFFWKSTGFQSLGYGHHLVRQRSKSSISPICVRSDVNGFSSRWLRVAWIQHIYLIYSMYNLKF